VTPDAWLPQSPDFNHMEPQVSPLPQRAGKSEVFFFKEVYFTDNIYSEYKEKLQNCSCNQLE